MWKLQCLLFVLKRSYFCYYIICMTVPLKIIYNSNESCNKLITRSNKVWTHQKHFLALASVICRSLVDINPDFMKLHFIIKEMPYSPRIGCALKLPSASSTYYEVNSVLIRTCLLWNRLSLSVKQGYIIKISWMYMTNVK